MNSNTINSLIVDLELMRDKFGDIPVGVLMFEVKEEMGVLFDIDQINVSKVEVEGIDDEKIQTDMVLFVVETSLKTDGNN